MKVRVPKIIGKLAAVPRGRRSNKKAERLKALDAKAHERRQAILKQRRQAAVPTMTAAVVSRPLTAEPKAIPKPVAAPALAIKPRQLAAKPAVKAPAPVTQLKPKPRTIAAAPAAHAQQHIAPAVQQPGHLAPAVQPIATIQHSDHQKPAAPRPPRPVAARRIDGLTPRSGIARRAVPHPISRTLSLDGMRG